MKICNMCSKWTLYKCSKFNRTILIWTCLLEYTLHDTHFVNGLIYLLYFFFIRQLIISNLFSFSDGHIGYSATGGNRKIRNWIASTWRKIDKNDKCLITSIKRCKVRPVNLVNWLCDVLNILMIIPGRVYGLVYGVLVSVMSVLHPSVFSLSVTLSFRTEYSSNPNELWILFQ